MPLIAPLLDATPTPTRFLREGGGAIVTPGILKSLEENVFEQSFGHPFSQDPRMTQQTSVSVVSQNSNHPGHLESNNNIIATSASMLNQFDRTIEKTAPVTGLPIRSPRPLSPGPSEHSMQSSSSSTKRARLSDEPTTPTLDTEEGGSDKKRADVLARNRQAALKCREKKKVAVKELEARADQLARENQDLRKKVRASREELLSLKNMVCYRSIFAEMMKNVPLFHTLNTSLAVGP